MAGLEPASGRAGRRTCYGRSRLFGVARGPTADQGHPQAQPLIRLSSGPRPAPTAPRLSAALSPPAGDGEVGRALIREGNPAPTAYAARGRVATSVFTALLCALRLFYEEAHLGPQSATQLLPSNPCIPTSTSNYRDESRRVQPRGRIFANFLPGGRIPVTGLASVIAPSQAFQSGAILQNQMPSLDIQEPLLG